MCVAKKRTVTIVTTVTSECRVKNNKTKIYFIRRPQQRCRTFAT